MIGLELGSASISFALMNQVITCYCSFREVRSFIITRTKVQNKLLNIKIKLLSKLMRINVLIEVGIQSQKLR